MSHLVLWSQPNIPDLSRRAAVFVVKILQGTKAADLPIERPIRFELAISLKAAKAIGLTVSSTLLAALTNWSNNDRFYRSA